MLMDANTNRRTVPISCGTRKLQSYQGFSAVVGTELRIGWYSDCIYWLESTELDPVYCANEGADNVEQARSGTDGRGRVYVDCQRRQRRHRERLAP